MLIKKHLLNEIFSLSSTFSLFFSFFFIHSFIQPFIYGDNVIREHRGGEAGLCSQAYRAGVPLSQPPGHIISVAAGNIHWGSRGLQCILMKMRRPSLQPLPSLLWGKKNRCKASRRPRGTYGRISVHRREFHQELAWLSVGHLFCHSLIYSRIQKTSIIAH